MKILFIAPLPPPVTGQSLASQVLLDELKKCYTVGVVNFNKGNFRQGFSSFGRIIQVIKIFREIWTKNKNVDVIYLTVSQTIAGNIKDLLTYVICFKNISRMIIHLHGGGIRKLIFDKHRLLRYLNKFFLKRLGGAVVLGKSLISIFEGMMPQDRIYVVPNFAEDYLFLNKDEIEKKFKKINPLRMLFLSNLISGKGHEELIDAYKTLNADLQRTVRIDFAGGFESSKQRDYFFKKIEGIEGIRYHGIVQGEEKKEFFYKAHIFCLPTYYYYYEGQPISILEAYSSGCVVLTTNHGGIRDIFKDGINGFYVKKRSSVSIKKVIENILEQPAKLLNIALYNRYLAERKFNKLKHVSSLIKIIERVGAINDEQSFHCAKLKEGFNKNEGNLKK